MGRTFANGGIIRSAIVIRRLDLPVCNSIVVGALPKDDSMRVPVSPRVPREPDEESEGDIQQSGEQQATKHTDAFADALRRFPNWRFLSGHVWFRAGYRYFCAFGAHACSRVSAQTLFMS